jgi:hypothetical protein
METPTNPEEFQERLARNFEIDRLVRSHIIYEAISLESMVDQIIAWHFCPDETKHLWFQSLLFRVGEVPFSNKIRILKKLLRECYPDIWESVPGLTNKLDDIRDLRNKFAHSELVLDEDKVREADDRGVFLRSVQDGKIVEEFISKEMADKVVKDNTHFHVLMVCVLGEVQNRAQGKEEAGALLKLIEQLREKVPGVLARVKS